MGAVNHHIPPNPGVTEIRVHGVGGTPPEALLEQTGVTQITGDDKAGLFRGAIPVPGRTVEAYSWGGLTTRSRSRAFWIVLLPFSMINLAGWMVEPPRAPDGSLVTSERTLGTKFHESIVQLIAITTTALYVMWAALLTMNALAFQCGALPECREDRWYTEFLGAEFFVNQPGRRVVAGLVLPLALLVLFYGLGAFSRSRYDSFGRDDSDTSGFTEDDDQTESLLGKKDFWHTGSWQRQTSYLHIAVVLLILSGLLARASHEFEKAFEVDVVPDIGWPFLFWVAALIALAAVVALFVATFTRNELLDGSTLFEWISLSVLAASAALLLVSVLLTWRLDIDDAALSVSLGEGVDAPVTPITDLWGFGWAPILLLALGVFLVGVFSVVQLWRWLVWRQLYLDQFAIVVILAFVVFWKQAVIVGVIALIAGVLVELVQWIAGRSRATSPYRPNTRRLVVYGVTVVVGIVTSLATANAASPYGPDWPRLTPIIVFGLTLLAFNVLRLFGTAKMGAWLLAAAAPTAVVVGGLIATALTDRPEWRHAGFGLALIILSIIWLAQEPFDGWRWNGPAATALVALGIIMGAFSGGALRLADFLDRDGTQFEFRATAIYEWLSVGFALLFGAGIVGFAVWMLLVRFGAHPTGDGVDAVGDWREALAEGIRALDVVVTMIALTMLAGGLALVVHLIDIGEPIIGWIDFGVPDEWSAIVDWASWVTLAIVVAAFALVRSGLRDPASRRRLGVLWDVATFWPRSFHPFAPPAYASRAVPELQARLVEVATSATGPVGSPATNPKGSTILSAHSQGAVLAVAAIASLPPDVRRTVHLVTHGNPTRRFYRRFFPRYFPNALLTRSVETLGATDAVAGASWLNFWRSTDPIGDPVFRGIDDISGTPPPTVVTALEKSKSQMAENPDFLLYDPVLERVSPFQMKNPTRGHPGYMADPAMSEAIDAMAALLDPPAGDASPPTTE